MSSSTSETPASGGWRQAVGRARGLALGLGLGLGLAWATPARADDTVDYVVKDGDTCYAIAARELGDRAELATLHRLNPQLGPLPHHLVAGQVLKLPGRTVSPDAHLTGASGIVRFRKPAEAVWDAARRGMELFRAWRVGAEDRSSAELTFRDEDRLQLRENTIVIIYGPERVKARLSPTRAVIEQGTLRSRLGELSPTMEVTTPTAVATIGEGSALVGVLDGGAASTVANHEGRTVALAGKAGGAVKVAANMGTRVRSGKRPEKPRPLLPPPAWRGTDPLAFASLGADGATVAAAWEPVAKAAWYRLEVLAPSGTIVAAAEVPANVTRFELVRVPVGRYQARVSSIDPDRLEGRPSPLRAVVVLPVAIRAAGAATSPTPPTTVAAMPVDDEASEPRLDGGGAAPPTPSVASGATVGGGDLRCSAGPGPIGATLTGAVGAVPADGVAHLDAGGPTEVRCTTAAGLAVAPFVVDVVAPPPPDAAPPPPPPPPPDVAPPPPAPRERERVWTAGGLLGWTRVPTGMIEGYALGDAPIAAYQLDSATELGVRGARWFDRDLFAEVEVRLLASRFADAPGSAWVAGAHAYAGVRLADSRSLEVRALVGGGGHALLGASDYTRRDVELDVGWGLTAAVPIHGGLTLRVDGRQHIAADRAGGVTDLLDVSVGLEGVLSRR